MEQHRIAVERCARGMSRRQLAALLGVSHVTVWRWETQGILPELEMVGKLSKLFGVPALELVPELAALLEPVTE
jgi:transcriptional regulator with XRE-family HTH domain